MAPTFDAKIQAEVIKMHAESTTGELKEALGHLRRSRGFFAIWRNGKKVSKPLARQVEELGKAFPGGLTGAQKQSVAVEVLMKYIPEPPWATKVLRYLLERTVNKAVKYWNDHYGKRQPWPKPTT